MYSKRNDLRSSAWFFCLGFVFVNLIGALPTGAVESAALPDAFSPEDLLWEIQLGTHQYTIQALLLIGA